MKKVITSYELGRTAFEVGTLKMSDDELFMRNLSELSSRTEKHEEMADWKRGRDDAKAEAAAPKKKKKKKKVSKKASKK